MEWGSVVFSDESWFSLTASYNRVLVRVRPDERLKPTRLQTRYVPIPGVMVWGAISCDSRSTLEVIQPILTANLYVSLVIQLLVMPFMNSIKGRCFSTG